MQLWFRVGERLGLGPDNGIRYWERRARLLGAEAVINSALAESDTITSTQERTIFPVVRDLLRGDERLALDLGCGPGRFTGHLAQICGCPALGVDPIGTLLEAAPELPDVSYALMEEGAIPLAAGSADVVFICLVLGAIADRGVLLQTVSEVDRVLTSTGAVVLIESEAGAAGSRHWLDRSPKEYGELFDFVALQPHATYLDSTNEIAVMAGRRPR